MGQNTHSAIEISCRVPNSVMYSLVADRRCLNLLRSYLHGKSYCWVRQKVITEKLAVDIRTVKRYYASLTAAGEISVRKRGDGQSAIVTVTSAVTSAVTSEMHQGGSQVTHVASVTSEYVTSENAHLKPEGNLKTGKNQSESTVQEHLEQAITAIEPSPTKKLKPTQSRTVCKRAGSNQRRI